MLSAKTTHQNLANKEQQIDNKPCHKHASQQQIEQLHSKHPTTTAETSTETTAEHLNSADCLNQNFEYVCDIKMISLEDSLVHDDSEDNEAYTLAAAFDDYADDYDTNVCHKNNNTINAKDLDELSLGGSCSRSSSSGSCSTNSEVYNDLSQLYLNDIELEPNDEEATISELVNASSADALQRKGSQNNRMRVAFGIILRLVLPLANGVARSIKGFRDVRFLRALKNIASSRQALTNVIAFAANTISMSLSSVQVSHRIEPLLKLMKISKSRAGHESLPDTPASPNATSPTSYSPLLREPRVRALPQKPTEQPAPKCCTLNVLAEPPAGTPIRADIVFIHGLHGSLVNTWKQGLWENERRPVGFERPPKLPLRPPKRPRHSRTTAIHPPHKQKRARFHHAASDQQLLLQSSCDNDDYDIHDEAGRSSCTGHNSAKNDDFSYICGEPADIQLCDGLEYSFPTFRLRMNDNGRQLQAELESMLNGEPSSHSNADNLEDLVGVGMSPHKRNTKKKPSKPKPSANDPNYSRCWPGDWLPIDCPGVRVIALNYTTDQYLWRPLWKPKEPRTNLVQRSREMAELLIAQRVGYGHPIIWVGHSKGGLFVKQIIVDAWESGRPAAAPFWRSARGVFFYSVPHRGSHLASIKAPLLSRSVELIDIEKNSKYLIDLHRRFACLYQLGHLKIEVFSFVETALTLMSVLYMRIVGVDSADPGIGDVCGIHLDHREICKPRSRECILYKELVKMINKVC